VRIKVPLKVGWNKLVIKVASGSGGFGFWCQVTNPGDIRVAPSIETHGYIPTEIPSKKELLAEPISKDINIFYVEPLLKADDPYGFTPW